VIDAVETADALAVAREAAADAVAVLQAAAESAHENVVTDKQPRDFVTAIDHAAEEAIVDRIQRAFPNHAVMAEESGERSGTTTHKWVIDPLDGTTNFMHGFPMYAVSIALLEGDSPQVGIVVDAVRGEWFTARAGEGAQLDNGRIDDSRPIRVAESPRLDRRLVATGFPFRHPEQIDRYLAAFAVLFERVGDMRRAGSAALDLAYVAAGRVDAFWELGLNLWDIAAGELLIAEAGGIVTDWSGAGEHRDTGWIAAGSPDVHAVLIETLARFAP
jgi:myo-inositol-1(or 4)-monophosphatase